MSRTHFIPDAFFEVDFFLEGRGDPFTHVLE